MLDPHFAPYFRRLAATRLRAWHAPLQQLTAARLNPTRHGDLPAWQRALRQLPAAAPARVVMDAPCVGVEADPPLGSTQRLSLEAALLALQPWRKGPFCLHGVRIDAEWRSDWKWARLARAAAPLAGRLVLDVGCGNGYYGFRALGAGAALVLGIDPTLRFVLQFLALNHCLRTDRLAVLPLADTDLAGLTQEARHGVFAGFDTLLSLGVLSHRRDAAAHLDTLRRCLRPGGELVLETLIIADAEGWVLRPRGRYARMRNVHALPSIPALLDQLTTAGFAQARVVDVGPTTTAEQRATPWMRFQSLADFLDPADPRRTVEGHPAPVRAMLIAERP
jgi:tRNA (mo5U34)-methyltransferase